jgi:hypothetical protein
MIGGKYAHQLECEELLKAEREVQPSLSSAILLPAHRSRRTRPERNMGNKASTNNASRAGTNTVVAPQRRAAGKTAKEKAVEHAAVAAAAKLEAKRAQSADASANPYVRSPYAWVEGASSGWKDLMVVCMVRPAPDGDDVTPPRE